MREAFSRQFLGSVPCFEILVFLGLMVPTYLQAPVPARSLSSALLFSPSLSPLIPEPDPQWGLGPHSAGLGLACQGPVRSLYGPYLCGHSLDIWGTEILTGANGGRCPVQVWDLATGRLKFSMACPDPGWRSCPLSPSSLTSTPNFGDWGGAHSTIPT